MLGDITAADEIYIVTGRTDMRKSIDGLCAVIEDQLKMDPSTPYGSKAKCPVSFLWKTL